LGHVWVKSPLFPINWNWALRCAAPEHAAQCAAFIPSAACMKSLMLAHEEWEFKRRINPSHPRGVAEEVGVGFEGVGVGHAGHVVDDVGKAIAGVIEPGLIRMEDAGDFL